MTARQKAVANCFCRERTTVKIPQSKCNWCSLLMSAMGNGIFSMKVPPHGLAPLQANEVVLRTQSNEQRWYSDCDFALYCRAKSHFLFALTAKFYPIRMCSSA